MMTRMHLQRRGRQRGVVLTITLVLLVVVALIAVYSAANVGSDLRMVRNMQASVRSLNSAEAGASALIKSIFDAPAILNRQPNANPLNGVDPNPLSNLTEGQIGLNVLPTALNANCPRVESGTSNRTLSCDHYRLESEHTSPDARTRVDQGVFAEIIGGSN